MVNPADDIAQSLLTTTDGLCWDEALGFRAFVGDVFDDKTFIKVSADVLALFHPLLPDLLKETTKSRMRQFGDVNSYIKHEVLLENIKLWDNPAPTLVDTGGYTHHLRSIKAYDVEPGGVVTNLTVDTYDLEDWCPPGESCIRPVISLFSFDTIACYTVVLDSKHPGWLERYQDGNELGANSTQLVDYMFGTKKSLPSVDMVRLDFV